MGELYGNVKYISIKLSDKNKNKKLPGKEKKKKEIVRGHLTMHHDKPKGN